MRASFLLQIFLKIFYSHSLIFLSWIFTIISYSCYLHLVYKGCTKRNIFITQTFNCIKVIFMILYTHR